MALRTDGDPKLAIARAGIGARARFRRRGLAQAKDKPTISEVAQRAQVAISTVSRVLNGGSVSELIKSRVEQAIRELGYAPSVAAQSLVSRRTGCIGLAVNSTEGPWFSQVIAGVEEALAPTRHSLLLGSMRLDGKYDPAAVSAWIKEGRVDGIIFVRYARRHKPLFMEAARAGLPVALLAPDTSAPADYTARCNNIEAGAIIAEHLLALGHRRVAFAGGPEGSQDTRDRLQGLCQAMAAFSQGARPADVWFGASYYADAGIEYAQQFLRMPRDARPSAVVLGCDAMALGFMGALLRAGVRVPDEVSVAGFDGVPEGELIWPSLTTVVQPTRSMAASACRTLLERIKHPHNDHVAVAEFGAKLLVRESTTRLSRDMSTDSMSTDK